MNYLQIVLLVITNILLTIFSVQSSVSTTEECDVDKNSENVFLLEELFKSPELMSTYQKNHGNQVIFIETSGRNYLKKRQACALESAARNNPKTTIIALFNSTRISTNANNATAQIVQLKNIRFYSIKDFDAVLRNTPLDSEKLKNKILASRSKIHHVSDAIRLAAIYKLGGWYFDIDTVNLKSLDAFKDKNLISTDQNFESLNMPVDPETGLKSLGQTVANGAFHMAQNGSELLKLAMQNVNVLFNSNLWSSGGATSLTNALKAICNIKEHEFGFRHITVGGSYDPKRCGGLEVVESKLFFPFPWLEANHLVSQKRTLAEWAETFKNSYSVDFYASSMKNDVQILRPQYYGANKPAFSYLGPKFCPLSFHSERTF